MSSALGLILFLCLMLGVAPAARADLPRALFTVQGVPVDVTSNSLIHARETAISNAQFAAVQRLMRRFVPESEIGRFGSFTLAEIERLVAAVEVVEEKSAGNRYVGLITVVFRPEEVKRTLRVSGVPFTMTLARPILVVPQAEDRDVLQSWHAAFDKLPRAGWLEGFDLPNSESEGDAAALARANHIDQIVFARIVPEAATPPSPLIPSVTISLQLYGQPTADPAAANFSSPSLTDTLHLAREPLDNNETLLRRAAATVMDRVNEPWIRTTADSQSVQSTYSVRASFESLGDWLALRDVLSSASNVTKVDVDELSVGFARLELTISGTPEKLVFALAQRDVRLQTDGQLWRITRDPRK